MHSSQQIAGATSVVAVLGAVMVFCGGNSSTTFPPGLTPLETVNLAPLPTPTSTDPHPETLSVVTGTTADTTLPDGGTVTGFSWVHGRGYVHASLSTTWAAMLNVNVDVDRRKVSSWTSDTVTPTMYLHDYVIHNTVNNVVTVMFDIEWRQDVASGTANSPNVVIAAYQKTMGTTFITLLAGSVVATRIDDNTTELDFIHHLNSFQSQADNTLSYVQDLYASIVAQAHGQPLPTY